MMRVIDHLRVKVDVYNKTICVLKEKVAEMEGCLCHCTDQGKGKGKEVVQVEEPLVFNYDSDDAYHTAPSTGGVKVLELIPIDLTSGDKEVKKAEGYNSCGCGCASHPILLSSDDNVSVAENTIPIRIQVECSPPTDQVVSGQLCIQSSGVIHTPKCLHSSKPSHITRLACCTTTCYQMVKVIEHICCGDINFPRSWSASLGFADTNTNSNDCGGDPMKSSGITSHTFPSRQGFSPVSRTNDEVA